MPGFMDKYPGTWHFGQASMIYWPTWPRLAIVRYFRDLILIFRFRSDRDVQEVICGSFVTGLVNCVIYFVGALCARSFVSVKGNGDRRLSWFLTFVKMIPS